MRTAILFTACFFLSQPLLLADSKDAKQPLAGGSRVLGQFPDAGLQHLPGAMIDHGAQQGISSVSKDPRSDSAAQAINKK